MHLNCPGSLLQSRFPTSTPPGASNYLELRWQDMQNKQTFGPFSPAAKRLLGLCRRNWTGPLKNKSVLMSPLKDLLT